MSYIIAIDQGTSSSRVLLFCAKSGDVIATSQVETTSHHPHEGWCEQAPEEILSSVIHCIENVVEECKQRGITLTQIKAVGITNQRETTIVWDKTNGKPLHPAIIWLDARTKDTTDKLINKTQDKDPKTFQKMCGLPISTYFSGVKLRWLLDNSLETKEAVAKETCLFGTVDSWLLWNLTGGVNGGVHATDVTNASRTMLMDLKTLQWHDQTLSFFEIPKEILPEIRSSSEIYGLMECSSLKGIPISGILGDQQAALVGQKCFSEGQAKNTYGTGNFLLYNTSNILKFSEHGLLTTVGYQFGKDQPPVYALEGSIAITGAAIKWLRDSLGVITDVAEVETLAQTVSDNGDVYFVPAFSGLFAPYWETSARGLIMGITQYTTKAHLVRATLEAVCFQTREILDAMHLDSGIRLDAVFVDGGMVVNSFLMQLQADLLGIDVVRPSMVETTALGAAIAAGKGVGCWEASLSRDANSTTFRPNMSQLERDALFAKWKDAVQRTMKWKQ